MEKKMENEMETREYIGVLLGLYWDNGKENGNYYNKWGYGVLRSFGPLGLGFPRPRWMQRVY